MCSFFFKKNNETVHFRGEAHLVIFCLQLKINRAILRNPKNCSKIIKKTQRIQQKIVNLAKTKLLFLLGILGKLMKNRIF